jgi:hypothetical protein
MESRLATKNDVNRIERELLVIKWMIGLVLGGIAALILKAFLAYTASVNVFWRRIVCRAVGWGKARTQTVLANSFCGALSGN